MTRAQDYHEFYSELIPKYWSHFPDQRLPKAPARNYLAFPSGISEVVFGWSFHQGGRFSAEVYIGAESDARSRAILNRLRFQAGEPPPGLEHLHWEELPGKKAARIAVYRTARIEGVWASPALRADLLEWAVEKMLLLEQTFREPLQMLR